MIALLYNAELINDEAYEVIIDNGIFPDEDTARVKNAKCLLRQASVVPVDGAIVCSNCNTALDICGDEQIQIIDESAWMEKGCPYCKNQSLEFIPHARDL